ncbi:MAG: branched-chain amino acid ABC transporter permease, partial [Deltaproteobacteria bacterium]
MNLSQQVIQYILSGLTTGSIYSLIGLGFAIIFNSTGIINFAQGEFVMLGGMLTFFFITVVKLPLLVAILFAILISTLVGVTFERLAIRPLRKATPLNLVIITIGASILIRGLAMMIWGKDTHSLP